MILFLCVQKKQQTHQYGGKKLNFKTLCVTICNCENVGIWPFFKQKYLLEMHKHIHTSAIFDCPINMNQLHQMQWLHKWFDYFMKNINNKIDLEKRTSTNTHTELIFLFWIKHKHIFIRWTDGFFTNKIFDTLHLLVNVSLASFFYRKMPIKMMIRRKQKCRLIQKKILNLLKIKNTFLKKSSSFDVQSYFIIA